MRLTARQYLQRLGESVPPAATIGISIIVATIILSTTAIKKGQDADVAQAKAVSISASLSELCHAGNDLADLLQHSRTIEGQPLCPAAEAIKVNPTASPVQLVSDDHIVSLIRAELARQPSSGSTAPSLSQVIDAVRAVVRENPVLFKGDKGDLGSSPSTAEIAQVVAAYFRANAAQFKGEKGDPGKNGVDGKDGSNGTDAPSPPTVTRTETPEPEPTHDSPPETVTQTETHTETATENSNSGGLGGILGGSN